MLVAMASVRLKPTSGHWFACFKLPTRTGFKRVQRSTGTADKSTALSIALAYERAALAASRRQFTQQSANRFLAEIAAISGTDIAHVEPIKEYLVRWSKARMSSLAKRSGETYQQAIDLFLAHLGPIGAAPLSDLSPGAFAAFRDAQTAAGRGPSTVNKMLTVLALAMEEAVKTNVFSSNPARGLNVQGEQRAAQRRSAFTLEQFRALVAATEGEWRTMILLAGYTGGRQQELAKVKWSQVDFAGGRITLERTKTGDDHWLPLHPALAAHLRAEAKETGFVLPTMATMQRRGISNNFRRAVLPLIGIKQAYGDRAGVGRTLAAYSLHSFRHSLASWLAEAGVEERVRMLLIGHEDKRVSRSYTHTQFTELATALGKVGALESA
jgi:integrase